MNSNSPVYSEKLAVNPDITVFQNNNESMMYFTSTKKYFRMGQSAIQLIEELQKESSSIDQLITKFCRAKDLNINDVYEQLKDFIDQMISKGIIIYQEGSNAHLNDLIKNETNLRQGKKKRPLLKAGTTKGNRLFSWIPSTSNEVNLISFILIGVLAIGGLSFIISVLINYIEVYNNIPALKYPIFIYVIPWLILHMAFHESSHAIACKRYGGELREMGVGLLYYVLPVAYVDLTDTYRLPNRSRALIALAGPLFDIMALSISSIIIVTQSGDIQTIAYSLVGFQLFILAINCNLFFPSDLYRAIESFVKDMNLRKHSFEYMRSVLLNKERPVYLRKLTSKKEVLYIGYAIVSTLYITSFILSILLFYSSFITNMF
ncbi:site-2 protease family protein [Alkalihalobacillus sp. R86527]|uniref:site-2 protease family protein n=1 Tax=Alkalihalobacillus sp. R86527 TaxID=3093863 RepID=UPI00366BCE3C